MSCTQCPGLQGQSNETEESWFRTIARSQVMLLGVTKKVFGHSLLVSRDLGWLKIDEDSIFRYGVGASLWFI
jgi:hypothetical protein